MSNRYPFLIQNTIFGVFVGASCMLASYLFFRSGQSVCINPQLQNVMLLLLISGGFIGTRKYREEQAEGLLSYSQALGCCFYILSIASILYAIYTFLLYKTHPELQKSYLQMTLSLLEEVYNNFV